MLKSIFATKTGMTQAWDISGKRLAVTKCHISPNVILGKTELPNLKSQNQVMYFIGFGDKKQKNMSKPLRSIVEKSGFSSGLKQIKGVESETLDLTPGTIVSIEDVIKVGDIVKVQGKSRGRGHAGVVKRHGFHGGPRTHGQSDRERAPGSIAAGTTPGHVMKGRRMAGHYGDETRSVKGLVVLHIDSENNEVWLSGPVPGSLRSTIEIIPMGKQKAVELDTKASGIVVKEVASEPESSEVEQA